jgi:hypothetical protein
LIQIRKETVLQTMRVSMKAERIRGHENFKTTHFTKLYSVTNLCIAELDGRSLGTLWTEAKVIT